MINKPELLAPAGDFERLKYALKFGADAVYLGATEFGMRASAKNFNEDELSEAVKYTHALGKKVYLTVNTLPTNSEAMQIPRLLYSAAASGVDALIAADLGVMALARQISPNIDLHVSTQAGITNYAAAAAAYQLGAKRVVLARELSLQDIAFIRAHTPEDLELEVFVHGSMCVSVSGRCLLSNYLTGRDANRGACTQPCRWEWELREKTRPEMAFTLGENDGSSYILNADDLCMAPFMNLLCEVGVSSCKIEGRAKSFYYAASVTSAYRRALDAYHEGEEYLCPVEVLEELTRTSHRKYSTGFYFGREGATQNHIDGGYIREWEFVGTVEKTENGRIFCTQRGKFESGEELEALAPNGEVVKICPYDLQNGDGVPILCTPHAMMNYSFLCKRELVPYTLLRKKSKV